MVATMDKPRRKIKKKPGFVRNEFKFKQIL